MLKIKVKEGLIQLENDMATIHNSGCHHHCYILACHTLNACLPLIPYPKPKASFNTVLILLSLHLSRM
jgi:hypothetical protein